MIYGKAPVKVDIINTVFKPEIGLNEFMHYQYLPIKFPSNERPTSNSFRYPSNLMSIGILFSSALHDYMNRHDGLCTKYIYVSAKKGIATPSNPLNRPGWHCDGFGTDDENYIWYKGEPTRFAIQEFVNVSTDHAISMKQFKEQLDMNKIKTYPDETLYLLDPYVVHATPIITQPQKRQFVKISFSDHEYNLEDNSHNYQFHYFWTMHPRDVLRNDPHKVQLDFVE